MIGGEEDLEGSEDGAKDASQSSEAAGVSDGPATTPEPTKADNDATDVRDPGESDPPSLPARRTEASSGRRDVVRGSVSRALSDFERLQRLERSIGISTNRLANILAASGSTPLALAMKQANPSIFGAHEFDRIGKQAFLAQETLRLAGGLTAIGKGHDALQRSVTMLGGFDGIFGRHAAMQKAIEAAGGFASIAKRHVAIEAVIKGGMLASLAAQSPAEQAIWAATRQNDLAMRHIAGITAFTGLLGRNLLTLDSVGAMIGHTLEWKKTTGSLSLAARLHHDLPELFPALRRAEPSDFAHLTLPVFAERFARSGDRLAKLRAEMLRLRTPWVDAENPVRSVAGYIEAKALASVVMSAPAESRAVVAAVRAELGDYRESDPVPDIVAGDPMLRSAFRLDLGFNGDLSSLPPAIISRIFADFGGPVPRNVEADPEALEHAVHQRARRAELKLRRFIERRMQAVHGPLWWKRNVPQEARREWRRRRQVDLDNGRKPSRLFDYASFEDYRTIIENPANWAEVFEPIFRVKTSILETLRRLSLIRNPDAHIRVVTIDDFLDLWTESRRLDQWLDIASRQPDG